MGLIPLGILSSAGSQLSGTYELIQSQILGSNAATVTFNSLGDYASTYKHLQIRAMAQNSGGAGGTTYMDDLIRFNGDTGSNYNSHVLYGNGTSALSFYMNEAYGATAAWAFTSTRNGNTSLYSANVVDILDAFSTSKNKTIRRFSGHLGSNFIVTSASGLWRNTASITSITIGASGGFSFTTNSRFSLYGIR
jgi:hypothetical protein